MTAGELRCYAEERSKRLTKIQLLTVIRKKNPIMQLSYHYHATFTFPFYTESSSIAMPVLHGFCKARTFMHRSLQEGIEDSHG